MNQNKHERNSKEKLILLLTDSGRADRELAAATLAWACKEAGFRFEMYCENYRDAGLWTQGGGTILGGLHRESFYFLNSNFDTYYVILGESCVFENIINSFGWPIICKTDDLTELYRKTFEYLNVAIPEKAVMVKDYLKGPEKKRQASTGMYVAPPNQKNLEGNESQIRIAPYIYPDIIFSRSVGIPDSISEYDLTVLKNMGVREICLLYSEANEQLLKKCGFATGIIDTLKPGDDFPDLTLRIARRWLDYGKGVNFCDPALASTWVPWFSEQGRLTLFDWEGMHRIQEEIKELCTRFKNDIVFGRALLDPDIQLIAKKDIGWEIIDPNRPAFPVICHSKYKMKKPPCSYYEFEPDDTQLEKYAEEGKILTSIIWHSGELAHISGVIKLFDLVSVSGIKMGIGVMSNRYKFCPDIMEIMHIPFERGGSFPYIEPMLYSAGTCITSEGPVYTSNGWLKKNIQIAKSEIADALGEEFIPKGHYTFLDIDLENWYKPDTVFHEILADEGFDYTISCAVPGYNKIVYKKDQFIALNHSVRWFDYWSPFMRFNSVEDVKVAEAGIDDKPGWVIGAFDTPIFVNESTVFISGSKLWEVVKYILNGGKNGRILSATPHTISRYARVLKKKGII